MSRIPVQIVYRILPVRQTEVVGGADYFTRYRAQFTTL